MEIKDASAQSHNVNGRLQQIGTDVAEGGR